jgi:hypothetical protein
MTLRAFAFRAIYLSLRGRGLFAVPFSSIENGHEDIGSL